VRGQQFYSGATPPPTPRPRQIEPWQKRCFNLA